MSLPTKSTKILFLIKKNGSQKAKLSIEDGIDETIFIESYYKISGNIQFFLIFF
jgi:hypothetical protein